MGTSKVNSSRKTVLECERDSKINVRVPAGHMLPLTFAFDFTASYFRISSVVPEPEPVIFKRFRFRLRFRPQRSGSTGSGSGTGSGFASLVKTTYHPRCPENVFQRQIISNNNFYNFAQLR